VAKPNPSRNVNQRTQVTAPASGGAASGSPAGARADSRRAQRVVAQRKAQRRKRLATLGGFSALTLLVVLAVIIYSTRDNTSSASNQPITLPSLYDSGSIQANGETMGDPNAKVVVQEWGDYQCPGCGQFARGSEEQLVNDYVKTGKIRYEFHDFPFIDARVNGSESHDAAEAAACAADQGRFWDYHRTLYFNQATNENSGGFADKRLQAAAQQLGLDMTTFNDCLSSGKHKNDVLDSYNQGVQLGISQTPTFYVNGQMVNGISYSAVQQAINAALGS
jgi:protein-disulfide isomerase